MSARVQLEYIASQIADLHERSRTLTPDDAVEQHSINILLRRLEREAQTLKESLDRCANVVLFFDGRPVCGSTGIDAGFVSPAVMHYHALINRITVGRAGKGVASKTRLLVTNFVYGSFGVELQEDQQSSIDSPMADAVDEASRLLELAARNDTEFDAALDFVDRSAQECMRKFLATLRRHRASVRLVSERTSVDLSWRDVVSALERVKAIQITETPNVPIPGIFGGVLKYSRVFEHMADSGVVVRGTLGEDVDTATINAYSDRRCNVITTTIKRVRNGTVRVSYRLTGITEADVGAVDAS